MTTRSAKSNIEKLDCLLSLTRRTAHP